MEFCTQYTTCRKQPHHYDASDRVDRLTYVDPVLQIQNFMRAGINYALQNGQCLYQSMNEVDNMEVPAVPVFSMDSVDIAERQKRYQELRKEVAQKKEAYLKAQEAQKKRAKALEANGKVKS